jgi:hypothetical protein
MSKKAKREVPIFNGIDKNPDVKIGELVKTSLVNALQNIGPEEIDKLQTAEYSREIFNLSYPLLQPVISDKKIPRYYSTPIIIDNNSYFLCSEWLATNRVYLLIFLENKS